MSRFLQIIMFLFLSQMLVAQSIIRLNSDKNYIYEGKIYSDSNNFHTSIKPYNSKDFLELDTNNSSRLDAFIDRANVKYRRDNFFFSASPLIKLTSSFSSDSVFNDYKFGLGASLFANYKDRLTVDANYLLNFDNLNYADNFFAEDSLIIPHFGKFDRQLGDYFLHHLFFGRISYQATDYLSFQLANDKNFLGDGYRSLHLSDNANLYPHFKIDLDIWKLRYIVLYQFLQDYDITNAPLSKKMQNKYATTHYLSTKIGKRLNINLFESVVWKDKDSLGNRGFDVNYLNPVLFFRPQEFSIGSPDNVFIGVGFRYRFFKNTNFYGQLMLDEFKTSEVFSGKGWWANKQAFQVGVKSFDVFKIKNLYIQAEYNYIRPFTYGYSYNLKNYGHNLYSMAHPFGANLIELFGRIRYKIGRMNFVLSTDYLEYGTGSGYGQDIYELSSQMIAEYGNKTGQGEKQKLLLNELKCYYLLGTQQDLQVFFSLNNINKQDDSIFYFQLGIKSLLFND